MKAATLFFVFFVGICAGEVCYECNEVNRDVFAGQSILMGHFTYTYNGNFSIEAITDGDWVYKTIHLHIGTTEPPLGPGGNPRPGHFPFVYENIYTKNFVGSFNIDIECGSTVYIAFHAEAIEVISGAVISSETAWAYGNERFPGSRWGWYSSYDACCNSVSCEENPPNLGEIGDQVWWDDNRDGVMNPDEQGLSGVRVSLFLCNGGSDQYAETTTDEAGGYLFSDLPAGCYNVLVSNWNGENLLADGYNFSIITTDSIFTVDLAANESFRDADFGFDTNNCPCSSADPCVLYSSCDAGECVFEQMECDDGIECTSDSCVDGACVFAPVDVECDDGVPCTLDVCEPSTGCSHTTIDEICKDDVSCTIDFCDAEGCHHTPDSSACDDNVSCTSDYCDDIHGCVNTRIDVACDDNNLCTDDSCEATGCVNVAISCDDGIACTVDTCDPLVGCIHTPDDSVCTLDVECNIGHCDETEGCIFESINCNDQIDCTFDSCDEQGNCVHTAVNSFCDDEIACTFDTCDPETGCRHTTRDNMCNDEVDCTNDLCDEELGCVHTPVNSSCDDGISCTDDICNEFGGCANSPMDSSCDDEVSCTIDRCDTEQGCVNIPDDSSCEDYDACTIGSCDAVEGCQYQVVSCDDQVDCTIDWCDSEEGCFHDSDDNACNDSDACTVDVCDSFAGCSHSAISCDDGVACTVDSCDPATGCTHSPMDSNCDDNNPCTIDICTATGCTHSADPSCTPPPSICEVQPFQGATPYNLFSLGSIDACNSDVEGRVAANGAITLDHYSVGLKNAVNGLYSLVSSSVINFSRGTVWYGNVISSENNFVDVAIMVNGTTENANTCCADLACSACLSTADASLPVDFETTESDLLELSLYWQSLPNTPSATVEYLYQSVTLTCASGESFNHFVDVDLDSITSMEINCPAGSVVLIDYSSNSDVMGNMGLSLTGGVSRDSVIHHFTSESLTISGVHVIGSVFAPFSDLYFPQGLITGQVIVGSVVSGEAGCSEGQININSFVGCLPIPQ